MAGVCGINIAGENLFYVRKIAKVFVLAFAAAADGAGGGDARLQLGTGAYASRVWRSDYGGGSDVNGYSGIAADGDSSPARTGSPARPGGYSGAAAYVYPGAGSHGNAHGRTDPGTGTNGYPGAHGNAAADSYAIAAYAHAAADELAFPSAPGV